MKAEKLASYPDPWVLSRVIRDFWSTKHSFLNAFVSQMCWQGNRQQINKNAFPSPSRPESMLLIQSSNYTITMTFAWEKLTNYTAARPGPAPLALGQLVMRWWPCDNLIVHQANYCPSVIPKHWNTSEQEREIVQWCSWLWLRKSSHDEVQTSGLCSVVYWEHISAV